MSSPATDTAPLFRRNLVFFLTGMALLSIAGGIFETTFNNYVNDTFNLSADARGFLEFPRELPGFLTALLAGMLFFLQETRIAAVCAIMVGAGMIGLAFKGGSWNPMLLYMTVWSVGMHLIMPIRSSVGMALAGSREKGRRLGQISSTGLAAGIAGCALVWVTMKHFRADYRLVFAIGGVAALAAAFFFWGMRLPDAHLQRPKFVWRKSYWLYYVLAFLFGARKQIFITFGPWVLVKVFQQQAYIFAQLWIVASLLGVAFQPWLGRMIDRRGERWVLMADSVCIFLICLGYGFSSLIPLRPLALGLLFACFVADQLLFGVNMARDTYLAKIAVAKEDVAPTLSLGITINHAVSMSIPFVGGLLWMRYGHASVFVVTAGIAVVMFVFSAMLRLPASAPAVTPAAGAAATAPEAA